MENMELKKIDLAIKKYRIEKEIEYHRGEVSKREPKMIGKNENVFSKLSKSTQNSLNKNSLERNKTSLNDKENKLLEINKMIVDEDLSLEQDKIAEAVHKFFENDKYGLEKLEFAMTIIQDATVDYEVNSATFKQISIYLGYDYDYLSELEMEMKKAYLDITGKTDKIVTAAIVGSIFAGPIIIHGIGGVVGAALAVGVATPLDAVGVGLGTIFALSAVAASGALAAAIPFGLTYGILTDIEKEKLKKSFAKLSVEETAVSLLKTCFLIKEIGLYKEDEEAKKIYEGYIEQYVDLKSDVDLRLFLKQEKTDTAQSKNSIFARADKYLYKSLELAK